MGEEGFEEKGWVKAIGSAVQEMEPAAEEMCLSTPGGRFHVRWDENGSVTALG
jgi:hypothetical protein